MLERIEVISVETAGPDDDARDSLDRALRHVGDEPTLTRWDGLIGAALELECEVEDLGDRDNAARHLVMQRLRRRGFGEFEVSARAPNWEPKYVISAFALHGGGEWLGACRIGAAGESYAVHHPPTGSDFPAMEATVFDDYETAKAELEAHFDCAVNWKAGTQPERKAYFALEHLRPVPA